MHKKFHHGAVITDSGILRAHPMDWAVAVITVFSGYVACNGFGEMRIHDCLWQITPLPLLVSHSDLELVWGSSFPLSCFTVITHTHIYIYMCVFFFSAEKESLSPGEGRSHVPRGTPLTSEGKFFSCDLSI